MSNLKNVNIKCRADSRLLDLITAYADANDISIAGCLSYFVARAVGRPDLAASLPGDLVVPKFQPPMKLDGPAKRVVMDTYVDRELRRLIETAAEKRDITLAELVVELVAGEVQRPDLAQIPRGRPGAPWNKTTKRPRKLKEE